MKHALTLLLIVLPLSFALGQPRWRLLATSPLGGAGRHDDVFFTSPTVGWVVNGGGHIYKTMNGGATWQLKYTAVSYLRSVGFADSLVGWAGSLNATNVLYSTTDGGDTWSNVQNFPALRPVGVCGISVVSRLIMFASGRYNGTPRFIKTTDGGASWSVTDMRPLASALVDCHFFNEDSGFVVGSRGDSLNVWTSPVILFTSNGGSSWITKYVGARSEELCWKISFASPAMGYVSIEKFNSGQVYYVRTTDRGQTWHEKPFIQNYDVQGIGFISDSRGWIGGWGGDTYETTDGGSSWHLAGFGWNVNRFRMLNDTLGYAVGTRVYKYSRDSTTVGFPESGSDGPLNYALQQNFPNPFNPETHIAYDLPSSQHVKLTVFDVVGREIAVLVDETQEPGHKSIQFRSSRFASGVYFYRLTAGTYVSTKKMIIMK